MSQEKSSPLVGEVPPPKSERKGPTVSHLPRPTAEQAAAAHAGPLGAWLIAAGPGTGKTFTMVERFCWLVEAQRLPATSILAVTFTDAAAAELRERVAEELTARGRRTEAATLDAAWIGTFHGVCARLLRENAYLVGLPRELRVLDELDQKLLAQRLAARLRSGQAGDLDPDSFSALRPDEVADLVRDGVNFALKLKGRGISPAAFWERALAAHAANWQDADLPAARAEAEAIRVLHTVYAAYQSWLAAERRLDFDDLVLAVIEALEGVPEFRALCRQTFRSIVVDEFQDTNRIQLELIRLLAADGFGNVAVVGDAKQSIYGWRDADVENIRSRFPGARMPLTRNRRSVQPVLDLATAFIRVDRQFADEPPLVAERGPGSGRPVTVTMAPDATSEARMVATEIRRLHAAGTPYSEIAILAHSVKRLPREFEEELRRQGVPYLTSAGSGFFDREEVKDVLALLRLVADPMDDAALVRALQGPVVRAGDDAMYQLATRRFATPAEGGGLQRRRGMRLRDCFDEARATGSPELAPDVAGRAAIVLDAADRLADRRDALTVADVLNQLLESTGYLRHAQLRAAREGPRGLLNLRKVFRMANRFERDRPLAGLADFVGHLDRIMEADLPVSEAEMEAADAVRLSTIHGAKGLEFPVVFLVNLRPPRVRDTERLFFEPDSFGFVMKWWHNRPHPRYQAVSPGAGALVVARQERRRMVYVAITRARDRVYISASREEESPEAVEPEADEPEADDFFGEIMRWALLHPEAAEIRQAEQLDLPVAGPDGEPGEAGDRAAVDAIIKRLQILAAAGARVATPERRAEDLVHLSFSDLHQYQLCPVRYRYRAVWQVPAPPDELLPATLQAMGSTELGRSVHEALAAWHLGRGADLLALYAGPATGREMLARYATHPLAAAETLGAEVEFNLRLAGARLRGLVDRVCRFEGRVTVVDYKTNARLDAALLEAYSTQLRLYGLAAGEGLLPGGPGEPRLLLFDLRRGAAIEVAPDAAGVRALAEGIAGRIAAGDFGLGPEHAGRPCALCAYRPVCPVARTDG
jgi:DNA helicase-2/ATP-dependent DNA helicase PcrA